MSGALIVDESDGLQFLASILTRYTSNDAKPPNQSAKYPQISSHRQTPAAADPDNNVPMALARLASTKRCTLQIPKSIGLR